MKINRNVLKVLNVWALVLLVLSCSKEDEPIVNNDSLTFSNITFTTREDINEISGPGYNRWSQANEGPYVDNDGALHLNILKKDDIWYCSEVKAMESLGYGEYSFNVKGIDQFNFPNNVILGLFLYESDTVEIDTEFSFWDGKQPLFGSYTLQPYNEVGVERFSFDKKAKDFTTKLLWTPDSVQFTTYFGWGEEPIQDSDKIASYTYKGKRNIKWQGKERLYMNLYLYKHMDKYYPNKAPQGNKAVEVVISRFNFTPIEDL